MAAIHLARWLLFLPARVLRIVFAVALWVGIGVAVLAAAGAIKW